MTCIPLTGGGSMCGNYAGYTKRRPKDWIERGYKMIVPYRLKWRAKLGKVACDCVVMKEHYQPYYGMTLYHSDECAIAKHLKKYPQMQNFFWDRDPMVIAMSD